jgi:cytochrome c oxidase subunit III
MARAMPHAEPVKSPPPRRLTVIRGFGSTPPPTPVRRPAVSNAQLGILVFIAFEAMTFLGLITAYLVSRAGSFAWPPPDLPQLPVAVTAVNTGVLLLSAFTMWRATRAVRAGSQDGLRAALFATAILGSTFLIVQGTEWVRLLHRGLTLSSSLYGATFYILIGLHALHVIGAVTWLLAVLVLARRGRFTAKGHVGVTVCATYWYFVCALWGVLFGVVYLY